MTFKTRSCKQYANGTEGPSPLTVLLILNCSRGRTILKHQTARVHCRRPPRWRRDSGRGHAALSDVRYLAAAGRAEDRLIIIIISCPRGVQCLYGARRPIKRPRRRSLLVLVVVVDRGAAAECR